jgi:NTE family protein
MNLSGRKVSLVLGSGGARGLAHIGAIKALEDKGAIIDEIVGCSIGSLIGGIYAKGELHLFEEWISKLTNYDMLSLLDFTLESTGWVKGNKVLNKVKEIIPDSKIEELPILFSAVTTNLTQECDSCISSGSMYEAIRASIAIPGVFTAVKKKDDKMIDGGVLNPLPLNYVRRKNNIIVAVNLEGAPEKGPEIYKDDSTLSVLQHSYYLMRNQITKLNIELHKPDFVVDIPKDISSIWDYSKAQFLIERGKQITLDTLNSK